MLGQAARSRNARLMASSGIMKTITLLNGTTKVVPIVGGRGSVRAAADTEVRPPGMRRLLSHCLGLASAIALGAPLAGRAADAQENWAKNCASCHGRDGAGHTKAGQLSGVKDLTDAKYQKTFTDEAAFKDTKDGLVVGEKTKMKPFADKLSDDEIRALVTHVRGMAK